MLGKKDRKPGGERTQSPTNKRLLLLVMGLCAIVLIMGIYWHTRIVVFSTSPTDENAVVANMLFPGKEITVPVGKSVEQETDIAADAVTGGEVKDTARESNTEVVHEEREDASAITDKQLSPCGNSEKWLKGPRHGNLHDDPLLTDDLAKSLILNLKNVLVSEQERHAVLGRSICHADGRFRNDAAAGIVFDDRTVRLWAVRLIYLAVHYHQHRHAVYEATQRYKEDSPCSPASMLEKYNVSTFDYECGPDAKFLITSLGGNGLGANVRGGMVPTYLMGLAADRVVLFINHADEGNRFLTLPWGLASCPRHDRQCFFFPSSPCTLTVDEISDAYELERPQVRKLSKLNMPLPGIEHHKVWTYNSQFLPNEFVGWRTIEKIHEYAKIMIDAVPNIPDNAQFIELLNKAAEELQQVDEQRRWTYNFAARWNKIYHALTIYSMRPNPSSAAELEKIMTDIIPASFDPEFSFGLPIRASDKCDRESDCLSFDEHMTIATDVWGTHLNETGGTGGPTVVFTTEAKSMVQEQKVWVEGDGRANSKFDFDFLTNSYDMLPGSGFMKSVVRRKAGNASDPDANMLSSVSSLQAQLLTRVSIGNCCSNFHAMLSDLLLEGCGAARENTFMCLQEYNDPLLRVCCGWHHDCIELKKKHRAELAAKQDATTALGATV